MKTLQTWMEKNNHFSPEQLRDDDEGMLDEGGCKVDVDGKLPHKMSASIYTRKQVSNLYDNIQKIQDAFAGLKLNDSISVREIIKIIDPVWLEHYQDYFKTYDEMHGRYFGGTPEQKSIFLKLAREGLMPGALTGYAHSPPPCNSTTPSPTTRDGSPSTTESGLFRPVSPQSALSGDPRDPASLSASSGESCSS